MALNHMIRRISASNVVPLAVCLASASQRHCHHFSTIISAVNIRSTVCENLVRRSMPSALHCYCSLPDEDNALVQVIEEEIVDAQEHEGADKDLEPVPEEELPFEIEDIPTRNHIKLTRDDKDEKIEVIVDMPILFQTEEDIKANDNKCSSELPLTVRIFRKRRHCIEFICTAYPDLILIESVSVKNLYHLNDEFAYEGPEFWSLDEKMRDALLKYLEKRGIKPSITDYLHEYMVKKDNREYLTWLTHIKDYIKS